MGIDELKGGIEQLTDEIEHLMTRMQEMEVEQTTVEARNFQLLDEIHRCLAKERDMEDVCLRKDSELEQLLNENEELIMTTQNAANEIKDLTSVNERLLVPYLRLPEHERLTAKVRDLEKQRLKAEMEIMHLTALVDCDSEVYALRAEIEHLASENKRIASFEAQNVQLKAAVAKLLAEKKLGKFASISGEEHEKQEKKETEEGELSCCFCS